MDWTVGTFWTIGIDALDTGDRLWSAWTLGLTGGVHRVHRVHGVHGVHKTPSVPPVKRRRWQPAILNH